MYTNLLSLILFGPSVVCYQIFITVSSLWFRSEAWNFLATEYYSNNFASKGYFLSCYLICSIISCCFILYYELRMHKQRHPKRTVKKNCCFRRISRQISNDELNCRFFSLRSSVRFFSRLHGHCGQLSLPTYQVCSKHVHVLCFWIQTLLWFADAIVLIT